MENLQNWNEITVFQMKNIYTHINRCVALEKQASWNIHCPSEEGQEEYYVN